MKIYRIISIIFVIILTNNALAQFSDVQTKFDLRQIRENERFYFDNIIENTNNFFIDNVFGIDIDDLGIDINLHFIFESINEVNNQKIVNGQIIVTNRSDIFLTLKGFSFATRDLNSISFNSNSFNPLSSLLEFSAYLLIANELYKLYFEGYIPDISKNEIQLTNENSFTVDFNVPLSFQEIVSYYKTPIMLNEIFN